jgi:hypothetical protein
MDPEPLLVSEPPPELEANVEPLSSPPKSLDAPEFDDPHPVDERPSTNEAIPKNVEVSRE